MIVMTMYEFEHAKIASSEIARRLIARSPHLVASEVNLTLQPNGSLNHPLLHHVVKALSSVLRPQFFSQRLARHGRSALLQQAKTGATI
jgi:hypothetical protein